MKFPMPWLQLLQNIVPLNYSLRTLIQTFSAVCVGLGFQSNNVKSHMLSENTIRHARTQHPWEMALDIMTHGGYEVEQRSADFQNRESKSCKGALEKELYVKSKYLNKRTALI